jgi:RND superfamily putative drug exporter
VSGHPSSLSRRPPIGARRPRLTLAAALVVLLLLAALGTSVNDELKAISLTVPGTESSRGEKMLHEHFGDSAPFAILLQGPATELDRQGPRLIEVLRRDPKVTTVSPWDRGTGLEGLRPNRRAALVLVDFHVSSDTAITTTVPHLKRVAEDYVDPPVRARTAGFGTVARAIKEESVALTRRGEVILAPILLIVLLFVFRSPVAAAIPLIFGATTVIAARGLISVVAGFVDISGFALSIATMIGLAVGVDYALLIVSRFREELAGGLDPTEAASATRVTAGRTIVFAGSILLMAVLIAVLLVPGALLLSLCATVAPVVAVAVAGPWIVGPAVLVLVGGNIDRWRIGRRGPMRTRWLRVSRGALRRPGVATVIIGFILLLIAFPAASLTTRPVTIEQLPPDDPARLDVEAIKATVGGGWISPFVAVAVSDKGPITQGKQLAALSHWQARVARERGVEAVIGPGPLVKRIAPLQQMSQRFLEGDKRGQPVGGVTADLGRAGSSLARLRRGLGAASEGARALALGSDKARMGASLLAGGLSLATSGDSRARNALDRFRRGTHLLASGAHSMSLGASVLDFSIDELRSEVARQTLLQSKRLETELDSGAKGVPTSESAAATTLEKLKAAWRELGNMSVGTSDPHYPVLVVAIREALTAASGEDPVSAARYAPGYDGLPDALASLDKLLHRSSAEAEQLNSGLADALRSIDFLRKLAARMRSGIARLSSGSRRISIGSDRIVSGAARLGSGLGRLADGAQQLTAGLSRLRNGNARLERGLSFAFRRTRPLVTGAREAEVKVSSARRRLRHGSPGIFESGYFVLSALDGAPAQPRRLASQVIDLPSGGQAAKILVATSESGSDDPNVIGLYDRLRASANRLTAQSGMHVAVTGAIAQTIDYERSNSVRLPLLVIAITLVTFLVMLTILRALPLAALAIALNLLAVAAAFGVLEMLTFLPEDWPFGGTHNIDPVGAAGIFGVVFGLSIDYSVFLLSRMRESWERDQNNETAITYGLERTASVITGAATIMAFAFLVLATAPIQSVAQFGVSLTVAVMLDATAIRLILAPALMKLIGPRVWWLPSWLERSLPRLNVHGEKVVL